MATSNINININNLFLCLVYKVHNNLFSLVSSHRERTGHGCRGAVPVLDHRGVKHLALPLLPRLPHLQHDRLDGLGLLPLPGDGTEFRQSWSFLSGGLVLAMVKMRRRRLTHLTICQRKLPVLRTSWWRGRPRSRRIQKDTKRTQWWQHFKVVQYVLRVSSSQLKSHFAINTYIQYQYNHGIAQCLKPSGHLNCLVYLHSQTSKTLLWESPFICAFPPSSSVENAI